MKINPATGANETVLNPFGGTNNVNGFVVYVPQRKEIVQLANGTAIYRYNISTKTSSVLPLSNSQDVYYDVLTSN